MLFQYVIEEYNANVQKNTQAHKGIDSKIKILIE